MCTRWDRLWRLHVIGVWIWRSDGRHGFWWMRRRNSCELKSCNAEFVAYVFWVVCVEWSRCSDYVYANIWLYQTYLIIGLWLVMKRLINSHTCSSPCLYILWKICFETLSTMQWRRPMGLSVNGEAHGRLQVLLSKFLTWCSAIESAISAKKPTTYSLSRISSLRNFFEGVISLDLYMNASTKWIS